MKRLVLLSLVLFLLTGCPPSESGNDSDLPESITQLEIRMSDGGGMLPVFYETFISYDSAYWVYDRYSYETMIKWHPNKKDIDLLYSDIKVLRFNKIESDCKGEVFDRGGISLDVQVEGEHYHIDNSGNCFIRDEWKESYGKLIQRITNYRNKNIERSMLRCEITVTKELLESGYDILIDVNNSGNYKNVHPDTLYWEVPVYPGYNEFFIQLKYKDSTNYYGTPVNYKSEHYFESLQEDSNHLVIDWKEGVLTLEVND